MKMGVHALNKSRFPSASHAYRNDSHRLFLLSRSHGGRSGGGLKARRGGLSQLISQAYLPPQWRSACSGVSYLVSCTP